MRHDLTISGEAYALRPAELGDSEFILSLRTDPALSRYINPTSASLASQRAWMDAYFERPGDFYWVVQSVADGAAEGTISIYDLDAAARTAEWGRWLLRPGSLAAVESARLLYRLAFGQLDLETVYCRTLLANQAVVSFHDSCGLERATTQDDQDAAPGALVEHRLDRARWPEVDAQLLRHSRRIAERMRRKAGAAA